MYFLPFYCFFVVFKILLCSFLLLFLSSTSFVDLISGFQERPPCEVCSSPYQSLPLELWGVVSKPTEYLNPHVLLHLKYST